MDDGLGDAITGQSFVLTVTVTNDDPTTTGVADVNVDEDSPATSIDLFDAFQDEEDNDTDLTYSISANTNAALFSSTPIDGSDGTLNLHYAANANGIAEITLRATDSGGAFIETTFTVDVNAVNDAPVVSQNDSLDLDAGGTAVLSGNNLTVLDIEDAPADITFTLTNVSTSGTLMVSGVDLGIGDTFTQDDINKGRVSYVTQDSATSSIAFTFTVTDGDGATIGATDFTITINAPVPPPEPVSPLELAPEDDPEPEDNTEEIEDNLDEESDSEEPVEPGDLTAESAVLVTAGVGETAVSGGPPATGSPGFNQDRSKSYDPARSSLDPALNEVKERAEEAEEETVEELEKPEVNEISEVLKQALDQLDSDLDQVAEEEKLERIAASAGAKMSGATLSAGYVAWLLRAGPMLASALSSMPIWAKFDPLPVLIDGSQTQVTFEGMEQDSDEVTRLLDDGPSETRGDTP